MRKILSIFGLLAFAFGHVSVLANGEVSGNVVMVNSSIGWRCKIAEKSAAILHTDDGGRYWKDVSPVGIPAIVKQLSVNPSAPDLEELLGLDVVDGRCAWVSILPPDVRGIWLYSTRDAGRHWTRVVVPFVAEGVFLNFFDLRSGYLAADGGPTLGHMDQKIYHTDDGGKHWQKRATTKERGYYTSGMVFRTRSEGWLTGSYRSVEYPLFHTEDGARSWQLQKFPIPKDYVGGYANTYPPVFIGSRKTKGYLPVELVRHEPKPGHRAWVNFESEDGGKSWHLPATGVPSVNED
jgi:hypothetical protein